MQENRSGGLDARTLLAFALMILVWVAFTQFFSPKKPPVNQEPATTASEPGAAGSASDSGSGAAAPEPSASSGQQMAPPQSTWGGSPEPGAQAEAEGAAAGWRLDNRLAAQDEEIVFDSRLYRAVFSTRGGVLRSWQLKEFTDATGLPADLIPPAGVGALALRLTGPEGDVDLGRTVFALERSRSLDGAAPSGEAGREADVLRFTAQGPVVWGSGAATTGGPPQEIRVERVYRLRPDGYDIDMELLVDGVPNTRQDHRVVLGWVNGIPNLETQRSLDKQAKAAVALLGEELIKDGFGRSGFGCGCQGGRASQGGERSYEGVLRWGCVRAKYFTGMVIPEEEEPALFVAVSQPDSAQVGMQIVRPLADEGPTQHRYRLYLGPIDSRILKQLDAQVDREVIRLVDYGGKLIAPISKVTHWFLLTVHRVVPNYGLVILVLALVVRVLFHPLTVKSLQSQRKLQELKPELDAINAKYKDNPELRTKKTMELHKRNGVNPLGGCLPLLVQMPVIYALYNVLMNAMELRKAPFVLWIDDLSSPDTVGHLMGIPINVLPLLMAATMFWQQKLTPTDPRQAPMLIMMPLMMVFFFYGLPSGLVLYWTVTNLLAVVQQMRMKPQVVPVAIGPDVQGDVKRTVKPARA